LEIASIAGIEKPRLTADERGFARIGKGRIRVSAERLIAGIARNRRHRRDREEKTSRR
jgi:hypothetical protein